MHRDCGYAAIGVAELLVRAALADLPKTQPLEPCHHLAGLEDWWLGHNSRHDGLDAYEFGFKLRFAILKEQRDDLLEVAVEFIERLRLAVGTGKAGDVADIQPGVRIAFDDCGKGLHRREGY